MIPTPSRRVIPVLLLDDGRLVKTVRFRDPTYVGDPVNVLSIFNDLEVDEIMLLDIGAARSRHPVDLDRLREYSSECFIPMSFGGAVETLAGALSVIATGVEKVVVNTSVVERPDVVATMVDALGAQAVIASVDVRMADGCYRVQARGGTRDTLLTLDDWLQIVGDVGAGEIMVTSIDREGTREGINLPLVEYVTSRVVVPVIAHGGVGSREDLLEPLEHGGASAVAAGSHFLFQRNSDSVVVNYPSAAQLATLRATPAPSLGQALTQSSPSDRRRTEDSRRICVRCIVTDDVPGAAIGADGVCYYCRLHDELDRQYPTGEAGRRDLERLMTSLRDAGRGREFDCIVGVSGGCDSSYLAHLLVEHGVRPLAVHFDNTWNSPIATSNIYSVLDRLDIPLKTYVVDNVEYDDLYLAFLRAGVRDVEAPTDIGFMGVLYRFAEEYGIRNIVEGHSFRTEGVSPLGWLYMDGGYISSVHQRFGTVPLKTYPNMSFSQFVRWAAVSRIQRHRPLYHLDYRKEQTKEFLSDAYGWQWYGGHHLENRFTAWYHTVLLPQRFGIDFRQIEFSALIRSGQLDRDEARDTWETPRPENRELTALVKKRLGLSDEEFDLLMTQPRHSYREFDTYKKRFERLRPFFWLMYRTGRVPKSFYVKFCT